VRSFLLQNLHYDAVQREYIWRIPLQYLKDNLEKVLSEKSVQGESKFKGPTLFISGGKSSYLSPDKHEEVKIAFPQSTIEVLPTAGHYPHFEATEEFLALLDNFLNKNYPY